MIADGAVKPQPARCRRCWMGRMEFELDGVEYGSDAYCTIVAAHWDRMPSTCMLHTGHSGSHEWTDDDKIVFTVRRVGVDANDD